MPAGQHFHTAASSLRVASADGNGHFRSTASPLRGASADDQHHFHDQFHATASPLRTGSADVAALPAAQHHAAAEDPTSSNRSAAQQRYQYAFPTMSDAVPETVLEEPSPEPRRVRYQSTLAHSPEPRQPATTSAQSHSVADAAADSNPVNAGQPLPAKLPASAQKRRPTVRVMQLDDSIISSQAASPFTQAAEQRHEALPLNAACASLEAWQISSAMGPSSRHFGTGSNNSSSRALPEASELIFGAPTPTMGHSNMLMYGAPTPNSRDSFGNPLFGAGTPVSETPKSHNSERGNPLFGTDNGMETPTPLHQPMRRIQHPWSRRSSNTGQE